LTFNDKPTAFRTDRAKVNFALSYLKGTALDWFEPALADDTSTAPPSWLSNWRDFTDELRTNFGPHDPVGDAEAEIENLRMREGQRITKYMVDFNRLSTQIEWGPAALRHQFYRGLPTRIKDEIARTGKPGNLRDLRLLAQSIDARYWERRAEVARENPSGNSKTATAASTSKPSEKKPAPKPTPTTNPPSTPAPGGKPKGPDLSSKLGKDGKLTSEERQRRFANNLCLFCGGAGHTAKECPKSSSSAAKAKARAAKVEESPDSKK
jgi:Retrotransposon gag protein